MSLLSRSIAIDFVRLEGLQKLTSVTAHDWDIYILKELLDNALDADEAEQDIVGSPSASVYMMYDGEGLVVEVSNKARFPIEYVKDIFELDKRVSVKDYYNRPTRGAQGNALKTILGIPYALQHFYFADFSPQVVSLSIFVDDIRIDVTLDVDEFYQNVEVNEPLIRQQRHTIAGTKIRVGIFRFIQKRNRTPEALLDLAKSYFLWNPHVNFDFTFVVANQEYTFHTDGNPDWQSKFDLSQFTPISWYTYSEFKELIYALLRVKTDGVNPNTISSLLETFGIQDTSIENSLKLSDLLVEQKLDRETTSGLYNSIRILSERLPKPMLGEIGYDHLGLDAIENPRKPTEHIFFYRRYTTPPDYGSFPFVLEVALLQTESLRTITVGINHSPTYRDPFYNKPLVPVDVEEPVQSLDQVLNFYGLDTKASLRVHIISPNIKFENYGKSAISDEPYRDQLMQLIHEVALEYIDATIISTADYLRKPTMAILPSVIHNLGEIFSSQQLVSSLKRHLRQIDDETIRMALKEPDVNSSLRSIIDELDKQQNIQGLTRRQIGRVALPRHPYVVHISLGDRQFTEIINKSRVRAILIANSSELEELLVSFQFPVHYDIAILRAERNIVAAVEVLLKQLIRLSTRTALDTTILSIPLWLVHDASLDGINLVEQVLEVADRYKIAQSSIIDLGLNADDTIIVPEMIEHSFQHQSTDRYEFASHLSPNDFTFYITRQQYVQIQSLTPFELTDWFERSLKANSITPKFMPDEDTLYRYSSEQFRKLLKVAITKIIVEAYSLKHIFEEMIDDWQAYFPDWKTELFEIVSQSLLTDPQAFWVTKADRAIREMFDEFVTQDRLEYIRTKWLGKRK